VLPVVCRRCRPSFPWLRVAEVLTIINVPVYNTFTQTATQTFRHSQAQRHVWREKRWQMLRNRFLFNKNRLNEMWFELYVGNHRKNINEIFNVFVNYTKEKRNKRKWNRATEEEKKCVFTTTIVWMKIDFSIKIEMSIERHKRKKFGKMMCACIRDLHSIPINHESTYECAMSQS
jgi:hypothetical protein